MTYKKSLMPRSRPKKTPSSAEYSGLAEYLVNFESANAEGLEEEFHKAVDDYLVFCSEIGKQPQTPTI